jgi:hypothetical protein
MPMPLRDKTVAVLRTFIENTQDEPAKLRAALDLIEIGEASLDDVVKKALNAVSAGDMRNLGPYYIEPALKHLANTDSAWMSEWVAVQVGENVLYPDEYWMRFATDIPKDLADKYLNRLERRISEESTLAAWSPLSQPARTPQLLRASSPRFGTSGARSKRNPKPPTPLNTRSCGSSTSS